MRKGLEVWLDRVRNILVKSDHGYNILYLTFVTIVLEAILGSMLLQPL